MKSGRVRFATLVAAMLLCLATSQTSVFAEEPPFSVPRDICITSNGDGDALIQSLSRPSGQTDNDDQGESEGGEMDLPLMHAYSKMLCASILAGAGSNDAARSMMESARNDVSHSRSPQAESLRLQFDFSAANLALEDGDYDRATSLANQILEKAKSNRRRFESSLEQAAQEQKSEAGDEGSQSDGDIEKYKMAANVPVLGAELLLARIYVWQGKWVQGEEHAKNAEELAATLPRALSSLYLVPAQSLHAMALVGAQKYDEALTLARSARHGLGEQVGVSDEDDNSAEAFQVLQEVLNGTVGKGDYLNDTYVFALLGTRGEAPTPQAQDELFKAVQVMHEESVGDISRSLTAKLASGSDELGDLLRKRELALDNFQSQLTGQDAAQILVNGLAQNDSAERLPFVQSFNDVLEADRTINTKFQRYRDFINPLPVSANEARGLLRPDETIVMYFSAFQSVFAECLNSAGAPIVVRLPTTPAEITGLVQKLRKSISAPGRGEATAFAADASVALYQKIFAPLAKYLPDHSKILLMPDGALLSIPFETLLEAAPRDLSDRGLADAPWLANNYSFAIIPSISALRGLRTFAGPSHGKVTFLGLGDPVLPEPPSPESNPTEFRAAADSSGPMRLHGAEQELRKIAALYQPAPTSLYLGARFNKPTILALSADGSLRNAQIVEIASHTTLLKGDTPDKQTPEPAIVLTPPVSPSAADNGYLAIGDIAKLSLDADWVILSACDTASADGLPNSAPLTGFARAFLHAKARALLVSHWAVDDNAAVALMTATMQSYQSLHSRSAALAAGEAAVRAMPGFGHPYFWAPFVVVGAP